MRFGLADEGRLDGSDASDSDTSTVMLDGMDDNGSDLLLAGTPPVKLYSAAAMCFSATTPPKAARQALENTWAHVKASACARESDVDSLMQRRLSRLAITARQRSPAAAIVSSPARSRQASPRHPSHHQSSPTRSAPAAGEENAATSDAGKASPLLVATLSNVRCVVDKSLEVLRRREEQRLRNLTDAMDARQQQQRQLLSVTLREAMQKQEQAEQLERQRLAQEQLVKQQQELKQRELEEKQKEQSRKRAEAEAAESRRLAAEKEKEKQRLDDLRREQEEKERQAKETAAPVEASSISYAAAELNYGCPAALTQAQVYLDALKTYKQINEQVRLDRAMMAEALKYRMKFTTKLGAVTNSRKHILQFVKDIDKLLCDGRKTSPMLYKWLLGNLAKQFVKQAESEVSVNLKKAFPLAALCAMMFTQHGDLVLFVNGKLMKKCPYIVPQYIRRGQGEDEASFRRRLGYKLVDGSHFETEPQYQERMRGLLAFYIAVAQTDLKPYRLTTVYGMSHIWAWVARILNMSPRKITPALLETFLQVGGNAFLAEYGRQADKVLRFIRHTFLARMTAPGFEGPRVRLELALDSYKHGRYPKHEGADFRP